MSVILERDGRPFTQTLHVRAFLEPSARLLVDARIGAPHHVYVVQPSEPLLRVKEVEEIVASYGPYERSWDDPELTELRALLDGVRGAG